MSVGVDQLFLKVTRIRTYDDPSQNKVWRYGTGFFYANPDGNLFLITNRHVIKDEGYIPNVVRLWLHKDDNDFKKNGDYDIQLYKGTTPIWKEPNPFVDIVSIPIDRQDLATKGFVCYSFSDENLLPEKYKLLAGQDVMIMGYPLGQYYDDLFNLPIIRNGIISSAYPVPFKGSRYFLVDARLHKGTSGSPVMTKFSNTWLSERAVEFTGPQSFLLGVNSSTGQLPNEEDSLDLNAVIYASIIKDITR